MNANTLSELLQANRGADRSITYHESESGQRVVRYGELYERALGILHHLQRLGARPGDRLVLIGKGLKVDRRKTVFDMQGHVGSTMVFNLQVIGMPIPGPKAKLVRAEECAAALV